jgi:hypothetical protein
MNTADYLITRVSVPEPPDRIHYHDKLFMAGSCFAEHISDKLERYKYDVYSNPFGILYNPVSLALSFDRIARLAFYSSDELEHHHGLYHSMDHHGMFSGKDQDAVLEQINIALQHAHDHLKKSAFVCISPGTSNIYRFSKTGDIAGNCHKIPQAAFTHERLSVDQCVDAFEKSCHSIRQVSPDATILWTVSPVRHLRDGLIENQRSKSTLLLAIDRILESQHAMLYFPAYEIMMDELRDYRYYARDLVHPSPLAVDILWDVFSLTYLDAKEREFHAPIQKIRKATEHRFLHDDPQAIRAFASGQLTNIDQLAAQLPGVQWQTERQYFADLLKIN